MSRKPYKWGSVLLVLIICTLYFYLFLNVISLLVLEINLSIPPKKLTDWLLVVLFIALYFGLFKLLKKSSLRKLFLILVIAVGIIFMLLLFRPYRIRGADVGKYREGSIVITTSRQWINQGKLKKEDIVIFRIKGYKVDTIGVVTGLPGEISGVDVWENEGKVTKGDSVYELYRKVNKNIPSGSYAVDYNGKVWLVDESAINRLVVFGI